MVLGSLLEQWLDVRSSKTYLQLRGVRHVFPHRNPRGSKYPIFKDSGAKDHTLNGFWDQSP